MAIDQNPYQDTSNSGGVKGTILVLALIAAMVLLSLVLDKPKPEERVESLDVHYQVQDIAQQGSIAAIKFSGHGQVKYLVFSQELIKYDSNADMPLYVMHAYSVKDTDRISYRPGEVIIPEGTFIRTCNDVRACVEFGLPH